MKNSSNFFLIITLLTFGCINTRDCCDVVNFNEFLVHLIDSEGENLLDPQSENAVDIGKTRLFFIENGQAKMVKDKTSGAVLDNPYGVEEYSENGRPEARFSFIYESNEKEIDGLIQWSDTLVDTLKFTFNSGKRPTHLTKISKNSNTLWDLEVDLDYPISITLSH